MLRRYTPPRIRGRPQREPGNYECRFAVRASCLPAGRGRGNRSADRPPDDGVDPAGDHRRWGAGPGPSSNRGRQELHEPFGSGSTADASLDSSSRLRSAARVTI